MWMHAFETFRCQSSQSRTEENKRRRVYRNNERDKRAIWASFSFWVYCKRILLAFAIIPSKGSRCAHTFFISMTMSLMVFFSSREAWNLNMSTVGFHMYIRFIYGIFLYIQLFYKKFRFLMNKKKIAKNSLTRTSFLINVSLLKKDVYMYKVEKTNPFNKIKIESLNSIHNSGVKLEKDKNTYGHFIIIKVNIRVVGIHSSC